jgi:hypothetical protein
LGACRCLAGRLRGERGDLSGRVGPVRPAGDVQIGGGSPGVAAGGLLAPVGKDEESELFEGGEEGTNHDVDVLPARQRITIGGASGGASKQCLLVASS